VWRPALDDYLRAASVVLDSDEALLRRLPNLGLAESALAAPFAGVGGQDAYPTLEAKAAVLLERFVRNHPLPDGNKRAALLLTLRFLEVNGLLTRPGRRTRCRHGRAHCSGRRVAR
jgi:death-on-curing protein